MAINNKAIEKDTTPMNSKVIALRVSDPLLYERIINLSKGQNISVNMAVNMLLGFAFNEVDRQNKRFIPKIIFETESV